MNAPSDLSNALESITTDIDNIRSGINTLERELAAAIVDSKTPNPKHFESVVERSMSSFRSSLISLQSNLVRAETASHTLSQPVTASSGR